MPEQVPLEMGKAVRMSSRDRNAMMLSISVPLIVRPRKPRPCMVPACFSSLSLFSASMHSHRLLRKPGCSRWALVFPLSQPVSVNTSDLTDERASPRLLFHTRPAS